MKSQNDREKMRRSMYRTGMLHKKISVDNRNNLFSKMKKGQNQLGGKYGDPSVSPLKDGSQKYPHCQRDPIIVRGCSNIDPNHLVIRDKTF